jgi:hypothetical protein
VCPLERTLFVTAEPAIVRRYDSRFLAQFGAVITPQDLDHPRVIRSHPAIPWWAGVAVEYPHKRAYTLDYDKFRAMSEIPKTRRISMVTTAKVLTESHRQRLEFARALMAHFGDRLDVYGHGFTPVRDKWDALHPYAYTIVLENCRCDNYWTEKLADAYLAGAFPFYCGCPNITDYFPASALRQIDRAEPGIAIKMIEEALAADVYEAAKPSLRAAREAVLERYNLFPTIIDAIGRLPEGTSRVVKLRPEEDFTQPIVKRMKRRLRHFIGRDRMGVQ